MSSPRLLARTLRRRRLLALVAATPAVALVRAPRGTGAQSLGAVRRTLTNGMLVVAEERRTADSVALQLTARAGTRDDGPLPGINAFTSRMMFAGAGPYPSQTALQRAAALVGGTLGRGTGTEQSFFSALVPATETGVAFELLSQIALDPLFEENALGAQKRIALQDLTQRRTDPPTLLNDLFQETFFAGHPASAPVLGTAESIDAVSRDALTSTRARLWGAANLVLTVVGKAAAVDVLTTAERFFAALPPGSPNTRPVASPRGREQAETVREAVGQAQAQFRIGFPAPDIRDTDRYPMAVLNALLSNRMFVEIRSERGLAYSAGSSTLTLTDAGSWYATAGVEPGNIEQAIEVALELIGRVREEAPSDDEVASRIGQIAGSQILADETNAARAARLASIDVLGDVSTEEYVAAIRRVSAADVLRVARTYLEPERALTVIVGPRAG